MDYDSGETRKTQNYKLAEEVRSKHYSEAFLLLTATPHQGEENHSRFVNLLSLLDEQIDFSGLVDHGLFMPEGVKFTDLVIRTPKKDVTDAKGKKVFKGRHTHRLEFDMYAPEARFYKVVTAYIRSGFKALEVITDPTRRRAGGFVLSTFQKMNASSTAAIRHALEKRLARLRHQLTDIQSKDADEHEDEIFDERYEGELEEYEAPLKTEEEIVQGEISILDKLLGMKVKTDRKLSELVKLIDHIGKESTKGEEEKVLIFTEYRETQREIDRQLEGKYGKGSVVVIHGGMKLDRREENAIDIEDIWRPFEQDGALEAPTTKRTSQRLFRDHSKVRFLVSTEAGGEGINLQFCHICVNYDLPWNPMRVEQRVGRVYRFGQDNVVQVYNFFNKETIEDVVSAYFENRIERAAKAIVKVTGEDPEEIKASLNGQLESEIDPARLYTRALVNGNLNKQSKDEIDKAVKRAQDAYEIATQSLFRDVSSYSFDAYQRELATELTLDDVRRFAEGYLHGHRKQLMPRDGFLEFLTPDTLKSRGLPERFRTVTFDRDVAIKRSDAEFLALGHAFIDEAIKHVGEYDFGGLTAARMLDANHYPKLKGMTGFLFVFVIRHRVENEYKDECLFTFTPVFVTSNGEIDVSAAQAAVVLNASEDVSLPTKIPSAESAFAIAKTHVEETTEIWDWNNDVEVIGASYCQFR